jgi:hypothetical protein
VVEGRPDDLPTPRSMARTSFRVHVWCKACRHAKDADLGALVAAGRGGSTIYLLLLGALAAVT